MNAFRVIFFMLVIAAALLVLVQNTDTLGHQAPLELDLWLFQLTSPAIAMYVVVFLIFILGIIFGALTFYPGNRELKENLRLLRNKADLLKEELRTVESQRAHKLREIRVQTGTEEAVSPDQTIEAYSGQVWGKSAMAGCVIVIILLVVFYYYTLRDMEQTHQRMDQAEESLASHDQQLEEVELLIEDEAERSHSRIDDLQDQLDAHSGEIETLKLQPQKTVDFITLLHLRETLQTLRYLVMEAETEEDRDSLIDAGQMLQRAIEHYEDKLQDNALKYENE